MRGTQIKNIANGVVVFSNGVARGVAEDIAEVARRKPYIARVTPEGEIPEPVSEDMEIPEPEPEKTIAELYEELGTWAAVAKHLGISNNQLIKLRKEAGIYPE